MYNEAVFHLEEKGQDWALFVELDGGHRWCVETWDTKPKQSTVKKTMNLVMRSFEVYHRCLHVPPFSIRATLRR